MATGEFIRPVRELLGKLFGQSDAGRGGSASADSAASEVKIIKFASVKFEFLYNLSFFTGTKYSENSDKWVHGFMGILTLKYRLRHRP